MLVDNKLDTPAPPPKQVSVCVFGDVGDTLSFEKEKEVKEIPRKQVGYLVECVSAIVSMSF